MKLRQKSQDNCILVEVREVKTDSCFSLLSHAFSLLSSKQSCFLFESETRIDDSEFEIYIVIDLLDTVMSSTSNMKTRSTR